MTGGGTGRGESPAPEAGITTRDVLDRIFVEMGYVGAREADHQIVALLIEQGEEEAEAVGRYIWDHWLGEPASPTADECVEETRAVRRWLEEQRG